jgi:hypothetical protein
MGDDLAEWRHQKVLGKRILQKVNFHSSKDVPVDRLEHSHRIRFALNAPGRFIFVSDQRFRDILFSEKRRHRNISSQHFHITFEAQNRAVLQDISTHSTTVGYDGQGLHNV